MSCILSSNGLTDIEANDILTDNINVFSNMNVSGFTILNNRTTLLSSLNVSGNAYFNNVSINSFLYVSGNNIIDTLGYLNFSVSSLSELRADNIYTMISQEQTTMSTLINGVYPESEIKFLVNTASNNLISTQSVCHTKINTDGVLNVYHDNDVTLPTRSEGWWEVHDELAQSQRDNIGLRFDVTNLQAASALTDAQIATIQGEVELAQATATGAQATATGAAGGVAAIIAGLGIGSIVNAIVGGGGVSTLSNIDVVGINTAINNHTSSISNLNATSTTLLSYINALTNPTTLNVNNLNVSQKSLLNGIITCISSLNVSGVSSFNNNTTFNSRLYVSGASILQATTSILNTLNVSGFTTLSNNTTINGVLNVSSNSIFNNNVTLSASLNISGFTMLSNNTSVLTNLNVSGFTKLNNATILSSLNVSGLTTLFNNTSLLTNLNVSGFTTLNNTTIISTLNISGFTTLNNNTNIKGIVSIHNGNQYAASNGFMQSGSLTIGDTLLDYGNIFYETPPTYDGPNWTINTSGLLMECQNNTEIAVHRNSDNKVLSLLCYVGGATIATILGRDMGWGSSTLNIKGITKIGSNELALTDSVFEVYNNIIVRKNVTSNGINYGEYVDIRAGTGLNISYVSLRDGGDITLTSLKGKVNIMGGGLDVSGPITATNIMKKKIFTFTCSSIINFGGTIYYRYDIDLSLYTSVYLRYSGQTLLSKLRKFKWMSWLTTGVHEIGYDLNYDISYSYKVNAPNMGLNVCAYGWPFESKLLSSVNPNGPFLLRNSFDYITFCCSVQNTVITAMIIDYL